LPTSGTAVTLANTHIMGIDKMHSKLALRWERRESTRTAYGALPSMGPIEEPSIALIVPWYGPLPPWFDIWLRSCAGNPTVHWLLFTDQELRTRVVPPNVEWFSVGFQDLRQLFEEQLEMKVCLAEPYQLCNFKIAYGWIFRKWLSSYDIWGYCDIDVVWGNLRTFLPADVLLEHQKIRRHGHLTLYQNTEEVVRMFQQVHPDPSRNYRSVFAQPRVFGFDEHAGANELAYLSGIRQYWKTDFVDLDTRTRFLRGIRLRNYEHQLFFWEDNALYREYVDEPGVDPEDSMYPVIHRDEFAYLHFQKKPMHAPVFDVWSVRGFYVTADAFVQKVKSEHALTDFLTLNPRQKPPGIRSRVSSSYARVASSMTHAVGRLIG
jgi:hypothetical protein